MYCAYCLLGNGSCTIRKSTGTTNKSEQNFKIQISVILLESVIQKYRQPVICLYMKTVSVVLSSSASDLCSGGAQVESCWGYCLSSQVLCAFAESLSTITYLCPL